MQKISRAPSPITLFATLLIAALIALSGCNQENSDYLGFWKLEKVLYEDNSEKSFPPESGAGVEFTDTDIIEHYSPTHKQRYHYIVKGESLELTSQSGEVITWQLKQHDQQTLHIDTPIGIYVLLSSPK